MEYKVDKKSAPGREEVEVLGPTFEEGKPEGEGLGKWRQKLVAIVVDEKDEQYIRIMGYQQLKEETDRFIEWRKQRELN